jgi:hypothetical protein
MFTLLENIVDTHHIQNHAVYKHEGKQNILQYKVFSHLHKCPVVADYTTDYVQTKYDDRPICDAVTWS